MNANHREETLMGGDRGDHRTHAVKSLAEIEEGIGRIVRMHKHVRSPRSRGFGASRVRP